MKSPLSNKIGAIFVPVSDIEKARDWYCDIFGFPADGEILFGHLYILQMKDPGLVLDSKIYSAENTFKVSAFHINTDNIQDAYQFMKEKRVNVTSDIQNDQFFNFQDPDGNHIMVCQC